MKRRDCSDSGATAVLTAILVVILFAFAALAVDLTNQFSRDRASQTTADLAALAGAGDLPEGCVALGTATTYMSGANNQILFDEENSGVGLAGLTDGIDSNGEIRVHDSAAIPDFGDDAPNALAGCPGVVNTGNAITVFTPPQTVDYVFAPVLGIIDGTPGPASGNVGSAATAIREGGFERNLLPFGLPSGCGFGQQVVKAGKGSGPKEAPASCDDSSTGNFGLLESPRREPPVLSESEERTYNLAFGLDHGVRPFPAPAPDAQCTADGAPSGAILDDDPRQNTANCLNVLNGNQVSLNMDALVEGNNSIPGRLTRISEVPRDADGDANCSEPIGSPGSVTDFRWTVPKSKDISITNTVLSCYLNGTTVEALAAGTAPPGSVDPSILKDPRFFSVPVLSPQARAQNGYWPVVEFRAAFITNETSSSSGSNATCSSDSNCNGLVFNNGSKQLQQLTVFVFPEDAIPGGGPGGATGFTSLLR